MLLTEIWETCSTDQRHETSRLNHTDLWLFLRLWAATHISTANCTETKLLEINQDNLHVKFVARMSYDFLGSRTLPYWGLKCGEPFHKGAFCCTLISHVPARMLLRVTLEHCSSLKLLVSVYVLD